MLRLGQQQGRNVHRLVAPVGLAPGVMGEQLEMPAPTLSFHLKTLAQAGLVTTVQDGRFVRYRAEIAGVKALTDFLLEDCCRGNPDLCLVKGNYDE